MIGIIILFITVVGIGNYFQNIGQKLVGGIFMFLFLILSYLAVKIFNKKINRLNTDNYGFNFNHFGKNILLGIVLAVFIVTSFLIIANVFFEIPIEFIRLKDGFAKPLFVLIMSVAIIGIWEEVYFRGLIYNTLLINNFGFHLSAFVSSILFSVIHWSSFDMSETSWLWYIGIVFTGYILAFIYTITKSIWSVASFHFIWNFMARLLDNQENEIGLYEIPNYAEHSKTLDNIMVMILGLVLMVILFLTSKKTVLEKINSYITQITTANKKYNSCRSIIFKENDL